MVSNWSPGTTALTDPRDPASCIRSYCKNVYDFFQVEYPRVKLKENTLMFVREWFIYLPSATAGTGGPQANEYTVFLWYVLEICGGLGGREIINRKI